MSKTTDTQLLSWLDQLNNHPPLSLKELDDVFGSLPDEVHARMLAKAPQALERVNRKHS